ncbi:TadE/TadG family type IV pilus assembly protein [Streptomyces griseus]|uniref:TadE/TadG family type IV pilus assembly protein n=1 Tax=Streptomyces griseus TaxID=1911 RepID=UPI0037998E12
MKIHDRLRSAREGVQGDRGSYAVETAILAPVMISLLLLMVAFGRVTEADGAVDSAARAAARAASLERDAGSAQNAARAAAERSLLGEGITCTVSSIEIDTGGFSLDLGVDAVVTARVACTANLSDIGLPGLPGAKTLTASWSSPIDTYRGRS